MPSLILEEKRYVILWWKAWGSDDVDVFSLRGDGLPFYNYKNAKELRSFAREKYPLLSIIKEINKRDYDLVFVVSMGRLSVYFSFLFSIFGRKSKESLIACEHVSLDSLSVAIRFLKESHCQSMTRL